MDPIGQGKENEIPNNEKVSSPPKKEEIKILEWRYNQFLGEKLSEEDLNEDENQSYIISEMKMTENGEFLIVGDKGGRIILFNKGESKKNKNLPRLSYFYEYSAYDKDFDVHKSTEYSEVVRQINILPTQYHDKIDILSCGYRTIKLHRVYNCKVKVFTSSTSPRSSTGNFSGRTSTDSTYGSNTSNSSQDSNHGFYSKSITVPQLKSVKKYVTSKLKKSLKIENSTELNSLSYNKFFPNQFISSDDSRVLLWDINHTKEVYNLVDLEESEDSDFVSEDNPERITKSLICTTNPQLVAFGTNYGNIKICDMRTSSSCLQAAPRFLDEFQNITNSSFNLTKTLFSSQIMSVHDLNFNLYNDNLFASRHYLSVNIWDQRNPSQPLNKFLVYEPIISKLSHLYMKNYLSQDKFSLSTDNAGKFILTGGYNNMFHIFDVEQRLNTQITIDSNNEKVMNTNIIRKINPKGSCFYKKDDPSTQNLNFDYKVLKHCYSNKENSIALAINNCIYLYSGNVIKKETTAKK